MKKIIFVFILLGSLLIAYTSSAHWFAHFGDNGFDTNIKEHAYPTPNSYGDSARYFPLKIGNKFYYKYNKVIWYYPNAYTYDSGYYVTRITDTVRLNGNLFYHMNTFLGDTTLHYLRYDADSGYCMGHNSYDSACNYENRLYKLTAVLNEMCGGQCGQYNIQKHCLAIKDTTVFGLQSRVKRFHINWGGTNGCSFETFFVKDIGVTQYIYFYYDLGPDMTSTTTYTLIGAFVNGVKYGDTNTVGIKPISSSVPDKFKLYQNYPNPFNPTTIIRFQISNSENGKLKMENGVVTLKVFDITGREIATLVKEKLQPGTYEVKFNGSGLASGIYFYTLSAGDFKETKKLVLLK